jgi:N utilization substance protein B
MQGPRRRARILALQALYEIDATGHQVESVISHLMAEEDISKENAEFTRALVKGVILNKDKIDENVSKFAPAWPLEQTPVVDRNILRLAVFEILFDNNVPVRVAINEAIELAKAFGSANSPKFVNGVLGSVSALVSR